MKKKLLLFAFFITITMYSQGCSDAGICSFSSITPENKTKKNSLEFGYIYGKGLEDVTYSSGFIIFDRKINTKLNLSVKINYNQANGNFGTLGNFGDAFLIGNYKFLKKENNALTFLIGTKIPFTLSNRKINEISLPLDYQPSLGTFDALLGIDYNLKNWNFNTAIQLPIFQTNKNSYFDEYSASNVFPSTNLFKRKPDLLARITRKITFIDLKKWVFKPNLLAIYHLGNDSYEDIFGKRKTIENSEGITINTNLITDFTINSLNTISLSIAAPVVVREIRPDGLTRSLTLSIALKHQF